MKIVNILPGMSWIVTYYLVCSVGLGLEQIFANDKDAPKKFMIISKVVNFDPPKVTQF